MSSPHRPAARPSDGGPGASDRAALPPSIDPDVPVEPGDRPSHHQWHLIVLVFVGGCVGTLLRYAVSEVVGEPAGVPVAIVVVNVVGAFTLGLVLELLSGRGPDVGRRRAVRLLVGTGVLGGFTTYSALAVDTDTLLGAGRVGIAVAYVGSTLVLGVVAAAAGIALGARTATRGAQTALPVVAPSQGQQTRGPR